MIRKIMMAILAGFLYWLLAYGIMELFWLLHIENSDRLGELIFFVMPFLFGGGLIIVNKERHYFGVAYSAMIIVVRYTLTFIEVTIRHPAGPSAFEQTFFFFKLMGGYSMLCAALGGILGVFLNKRVFSMKNETIKGTGYFNTRK